MKTYQEFHGDILLTEIGKRLREIVKSEKKSFKIMTGYGASSGLSKSKHAALKSLTNMKKSGLIKGFFPGEVKSMLLTEKSVFYESKLNYEKLVKHDADYGNEGIVFIIV